jgi:hypothetical protein
LYDDYVEVKDKDLLSAAADEPSSSKSKTSKDEAKVQDRSTRAQRRTRTARSTSSTPKPPPKKPKPPSTTPDFRVGKHQIPERYVEMLDTGLALALFEQLSALAAYTPRSLWKKDSKGLTYSTIVTTRICRDVAAILFAIEGGSPIHLDAVVRQSFLSDQKLSKLVEGPWLESLKANDPKKGNTLCLTDAFGLIFHPEDLVAGAKDQGELAQIARTSNRKLFWACKEKYISKLIQWAHDKKLWPPATEGKVSDEETYIRHLYNTVVLNTNPNKKAVMPINVFGARFSFGWPTAAQWHSLRVDYGVPNHFHVLYPGDAYVIRNGTFHMVVNEGVSFTLAWDDLFTHLNRYQTK